MLNDQIKETQKDTILVDQLKEELSGKDITQASGPRRIASIDFIKGIAIIFIILCHVSASWFDSDWVFLHVSIPPMKLDTTVRDAIGHLGQPPLGHGDFLNHLFSRDVVCDE